MDIKYYYYTYVNTQGVIGIRTLFMYNYCGIVIHDFTKRKEKF